MIYCPDPAYLVSRSATTTASKTLQELIQVERTHEASFRAWNQQSLAANEAINSWALADSADDRIIDVLSQVSRLLSKSVKAQNQYAIALADYRGCLKEIMIKESHLRQIQREREILLKRLLKLNKQAHITNPANSLNLQIKLDDAKRELSICQMNLKTASDSLFNAKQFALREALKLKLTKFEQLGHTIKLNAAQAIQLLTQHDPIDSNPSSADDESDFESCDEDPTLDVNPNNPISDSTSKDQQPSHTTPPTQSQQPTLNQVQSPGRTASPGILKAVSNSNTQSRGLPVAGAVKRAPKVIVKRRPSPRFKKRTSHLTLPVQSKSLTVSPHLTNRTSQPPLDSNPRPRHVRKRSQSLNLEVGPIPQPYRTTRSVQHVRKGSLGRPYPHSANGSSRANIGSLPPSSIHKTRDSLNSFKLFSRGMFSKFGAKGKRKEDSQPSNQLHWSQSSQSNQTHPQPGSGALGVETSRREASLWPTIEPLSLYSDSEDSGSDECSSSQGDDELETAELADRVSGLGRPVLRNRPVEAAGGSSESGPSRSAPRRCSLGTPTTYPGARRRSRPLSYMRGRAESEVDGSAVSDGPDRHQLVDYLPSGARHDDGRRQREHRKAVEALMRNLEQVKPARRSDAAHRPAIGVNPHGPHEVEGIDRLSNKENQPAHSDHHLVQYDSDYDLSEDIEAHHQHPHGHDPMPMSDQLHRQHQQLEQIQHMLLLQRQQQEEEAEHHQQQGQE